MNIFIILLTFFSFSLIFLFFLAKPAHAAREEAKNLSPEEAFEELVDGNRRYVNKECRTHEDNSIIREHTAEHGQYPIATVIACSDSRSPVETILDQDNGDIFVIRVAGNIGGSQVIGSVEYSLMKLNVPLVVVLGHTRCGAIYSAVDAVYAKQEFSPNIEKLLTPLLTLAFQKCREFPNPTEEEMESLKDSLVEENVWKEMNQLVRTSEIIRDRVRSNELILVGGVYDIQTGEIHWLGQYE